MSPAKDVRECVTGEEILDLGLEISVGVPLLEKGKRNAQKRGQYEHRQRSKGRSAVSGSEVGRALCANSSAVPNSATFQNVVSLPELNGTKTNTLFRGLSPSLTKNGHRVL